MLSVSDSILNLTKILKTVKFAKTINHQFVLEDSLNQIEENLKKEIDTLTEILIKDQQRVD